MGRVRHAGIKIAHFLFVIVTELHGFGPRRIALGISRRKTESKHAGRHASRSDAQQASTRPSKTANKLASKQVSIMTFGFYSREGVYQ